MAEGFARWQVTPIPSNIGPCSLCELFGWWASTLVGVGEDGKCSLGFGSMFEELSEADRYSVATHEVGHCLGMVEGADPTTLMGNPLLGYPTRADILLLRQNWQKVVVGPLVYD